jgi:hypothetical protein
MKTKPQQVTAMLSGLDLEDAKYIQDFYSYGHLGMIVRPAVQYFAKYLRERPTHEDQKPNEIQTENPAQPQSNKPEVWDIEKGDPLPEPLQPEPPISAEAKPEQIQDFLNEVTAAPLLQRPSKIITKTNLDHLTPSNRRWLKKCLVLDNGYQDKPWTSKDREQSPQWIKTLWETHNLSEKAEEIIERDLKKMRLSPDFEKYALLNPRFPEIYRAALEGTTVLSLYSGS